jgi:hypothetical protein
MWVAELSCPELVNHYRDLAAEFGDDHQLMLRLVESLSQKKYAPKVSAGTSHESLVVKAGKDMISIDGLGKAFHIRYWDHSTNKVVKHDCEYFEAEELIDSLILRLSLQGEFSTASL